MDGRLNLFVPYEHSKVWHENQLTRALLVLLRYSPMCHSAWLRLIDPSRTLSELPQADFATQRQRVLHQDLVLTQEESIEGISVYLAPDAPPIQDEVAESDRAQILDGIVTYGKELVVVIENKISFGSVTDQPHKINLHESKIVFGEKPQSVTWQSLLTAFSGILDRDLVFGAERMLVSDFLEYVETHFDAIGPYLTLSSCGTSQSRMERRLVNILGEVLRTSSKSDGSWNIVGTPKVAQALLRLTEGATHVGLYLWPGDTLSQARAVYSDASSVRDLIALERDGWTLEPNYHWGFMASGLAWAKPRLHVAEYMHFWLSNIETTRQLARDQWDTFWAKLEMAQIVGADDRADFDRSFTATLRPNAQPRAGIKCVYQWPLSDAKNLDSVGELVKEVRLRVNQVLGALRAPTI